MLSLQTYTKQGWVPVGAPYELADAQRVQQAATSLSGSTGAVWRVVGADGRVLALWDGRRWQTVAEAQPMPTPFWSQDGAFSPTVPINMTWGL